jgi:DNA-binding MarR family transcriptional regulator
MHKPGRIRSERWSDIALLCRAEPRTVPAIARVLGVEAGSIQSLILSMKREELLEEVESDARGTSLKLTRHGRAELKKHEATGGVDALLGPGERLVFVIDEGRGISAEALADLAADPNFRWAARVDGPVKWIASFGSGDAAAADRAANALVDGGARAVVGRSDAFFDAPGLADFAERLASQPRPAIRSAKP